MVSKGATSFQIILKGSCERNINSVSLEIICQIKMYLKNRLYQKTYYSKYDLDLEQSLSSLIDSKQKIGFVIYFLTAISRLT